MSYYVVLSVPYEGQDVRQFDTPQDAVDFAAPYEHGDDPSGTTVSNIIVGHGVDFWALKKQVEQERDTTDASS